MAAKGGLIGQDGIRIKTNKGMRAPSELLVSEWAKSALQVDEPFICE